IGATVVSSWPSSRPCSHTAATVRSCLHREDTSHSSPPAPEPTKSAPLPVATRKTRWSLRLRAFRRAARPNRIGPEPRSLGRRRRAARRIGAIFSTGVSWSAAAKASVQRRFLELLPWRGFFSQKTRVTNFSPPNPPCPSVLPPPTPLASTILKPEELKNTRQPRPPP